MHCYICDHEDETIGYDRRTGEFGTCKVCAAVIEDCISSYDNRDEYEDYE
jgi:hypothetical protein